MKVRKRHDQFRVSTAAARHHVVGGPNGESHLLLGAEQDDVRERRFHGVAYAASPV